MELQLKKFLHLAIAVAVIVPATSMATQSDSSVGNNVDTNQLDNFYVAGNLGETQYRSDISHPNSVFQNLRFGWRWNGIVGPEVGYAYLGRRKDVLDNPLHDSESSVNARAATIGISSKYNFYQNWFVTAHGGYLRSRRTDDDTYYRLDSTSTHTSWNNGWYGGVGTGYDLTKNVSVAVNYDNYYLQYGHPGEFRNSVNVASFSGSIEYRF
jgi:OmpA-OmpF porin, OOP family